MKHEKIVKQILKNINQLTDLQPINKQTLSLIFSNKIFAVAEVGILQNSWTNFKCFLSTQDT